MLSVSNRTEILKYLLTCNPKKQKDLELGKYIDVIKEAYPVAAYVETVFKDFHRIIMGNSPDEIDVFITNSMKKVSYQLSVKDSKKGYRPGQERDIPS